MLKDTYCKCPECGTEILLSDALKEETLKQITAEISSENMIKLRDEFENEKQLLRDQIREKTEERMMKTFEEKDRTLTALQDEMTDLKMKSIELRGKLTNAQSEVDKTVSIKLAEQKEAFDADKAASDKAFEIKIDQLSSDLKKASERVQQGSMQAQGEASELALEKQLKTNFPLIRL